MSGYFGLECKLVENFGKIPDQSSYNPIVENDKPLVKQIKQDLLLEEEECSLRGLANSKKWISEMLFSLKDVVIEESHKIKSKDEFLKSERREYELAKSIFDLKEYDRAAYFTKNCTTDIGRFLHLYSRYLSGLRKNNYDIVDPLHSSASSNDCSRCPYLLELQTELSGHCSANDSERSKQFADSILPCMDGDENLGLDPYQLWLYGSVLRRLDLRDRSLDVLCAAVRGAPCHWGAWLELAGLVTHRDMVSKLNVPTEHWIYKFFLAHIYVELHMSEEAAELYGEMQQGGLGQCTYVKAQMVHVLNDLRDLDGAISLYETVRAQDPFRLEGADLYSNLLFVKERRAQLAYFAHHMTSVDKYCLETCCVVGNYYSLRGQHEKAVQYFERALRLNPDYLMAWTLMGHEYMMIKNTKAAIRCYRQAIEVNRRDYRAWYGLGQTYEVLKLHAYCIYYFKQAHLLHPNDSRTLVALGDSYQRLERLHEAKKCYHKAFAMGDAEGIVLFRLATLYDHLGEKERAFAVYERFLLEEADTQAPGSSEEEKGRALLFLAEHLSQKGGEFLGQAQEYAHKCMQYSETREAGKAILNDIAAKKQTDQSTVKQDDCSGVCASSKRPLGGRQPQEKRVPPLLFSPEQQQE